MQRWVSRKKKSASCLLTLTIVFASTSSVTDSIPLRLTFNLLPPSRWTTAFRQCDTKEGSAQSLLIQHVLYLLYFTFSTQAMWPQVKRWFWLTLIFSPVTVSSSASCPMVKVLTRTFDPVVTVTLKLSPVSSISEMLLISLPFWMRSSGRPKTESNQLATS